MAILLTDSNSNHLTACQSLSLKRFKAAALWLSDLSSNLSVGFLFHKHGVISGSIVVELWELLALRGSKGAGSSFMSELCKLADTHGITLVLSLARKGSYGGKLWKKTTSRERLVRFYSRFGFVFNTSESDERLDLPATMHRNPIWK